jgi:hypothetical protein
MIANRLGSNESGCPILVRGILRARVGLFAKVFLLNVLR